MSSTPKVSSQDVSLAEQELVSSLSWLIGLRWLAGIGVLLATFFSDSLFDLEIQMRPVTRPLCHAAMAWAAKLQHARAYDSLYLALAEQEHATLWTADKRLVNGARQHGFSHIAWIGENESEENLNRHTELDKRDEMGTEMHYE